MAFTSAHKRFSYPSITTVVVLTILFSPLIGALPLPAIDGEYCKRGVQRVSVIQLNVFNFLRIASQVAREAEGAESANEMPQIWTCGC